MKERPVVPLLLSMALPMVISMMVNSLYNIVDSFFVAKISEDAMTALSLVFPVQNFINAVGIGFGVGINAVIALYLGEGNEEKADKAATQGLVCAAVHSVIMTAGSIAVMPSFLRVFTSSEEVLSYGIRYSRIAFLFAPVIMFAMAFEKIYQAVGKMKVTMTSLMCGCIANIILDPVLIFGIGPFPKMGIEGAALATGIGQLLPLIIYLVLYLVCAIRVRIRISDIKPDKYIIGKLYSIGIPGTLNLALPSLFVLGIYYKLQTFLYLSVNGIIQGMRPLIGFNYGAKEYKRVQKIFRVVLLMSVVIMAVGTLLCLTVPGTLMGMFTDVPETIRVGETALRIISAGFIVSSVSVVASGALEGIGKGIPSLIISLCRYIVVIIPMAFLLSSLIGPTGVWHAFWIAELVTAVISAILWKRSSSYNI